MVERDKKIVLDIDRDRLREIVSESLRIIKDYSGGSFLAVEEDILKNLDDVLDSNMVSTEFFLPIYLDKIPDLTLRIDPRRREVLCISSFKKKVSRINSFIRVL